MNKLSTQVKQIKATQNEVNVTTQFLSAYCRAFVCVPYFENKKMTIWLN